MSPAVFVPEPSSYDELSRQAAAPTRWVWHGYLAAGAVTLFTSRWKAGKTTLLSVLLSRLKAGGELAGRPVAAGRAVVVSEEAPALWAQRGRRLGFGPHLSFLCRPFLRKPSPAEWQALIDRLAGPAWDLVVIDPLAAFLPGPDENHAATVLAALAPLQRLTAAGSAVLLLHHPRKEDGEPRGSGALSGFADVMIEMTGPRSSGDRQRRLRAGSRFPETPADHLIDLSADGTDYAAVAAPDREAETFAAGWAVLRTVLEDATHKLTRQEVQRQWPQDHAAPGLTLLWEWLDRAVAAGLVARDGLGRRSSPFRYWLPGREAELDADDLIRLEELPPMDQGAWLRMAKAVLRRRDDDDREADRRGR
jgi:AAA domain